MKKLYEQFNHEVRLKLKSMLEDINTEVDKETWGDPEEKKHPEGCKCPICTAEEIEEPSEEPVEEPAPAEEPVDNSDIISVDDEVEEEDEADKEDIVDFLTKDSQKDIEPNEPTVLSEFDDLSNEEKKALLLKLAKEDNNLDSILKDYMDKKCPAEEKIEEKCNEEEDRYGDYAVNANEEED